MCNFVCIIAENGGDFMQKKKKPHIWDFRRIMAALLCLVLTLSYMPTNVRAAEFEPGDDAGLEASVTAPDEGVPAAENIEGGAEPGEGTGDVTTPEPGEGTAPADDADPSEGDDDEPEGDPAEGEESEKLLHEETEGEEIVEDEEELVGAVTLIDYSYNLDRDAGDEQAAAFNIEFFDGEKKALLLQKDISFMAKQMPVEGLR